MQVTSCLGLVRQGFIAYWTRYAMDYTKSFLAVCVFGLFLAGHGLVRQDAVCYGAVGYGVTGHCKSRISLYAGHGV